MFPTTSVSSGNISLPSPAYYECHFLLWLSHTFCLPKVLHTCWSLGIGTFDHHTYVETTTTVFPTALRERFLEVPGKRRSVRWRELAMRPQGVFFLLFASHWMFPHLQIAHCLKSMQHWFQSCVVRTCVWRERTFCSHINRKHVKKCHVQPSMFGHEASGLRKRQKSHSGRCMVS